MLPVFFFDGNRANTRFSETEPKPVLSVCFKDFSRFHCFIRPAMPQPFIVVSRLCRFVMAPTCAIRFPVFTQPEKSMLHSFPHRPAPVEFFCSSQYRHPYCKACPVIAGHILFLQQCFQVVQPGGKIIPDGFFHVHEQLHYIHRVVHFTFKAPGHFCAAGILCFCRQG